MSKNLSDLSFRKGILNNLFEKMGEASAEEGAPSDESLNQLAEEFLVGKANTYGTTSFYDFMKAKNKGKKVYICNGSACICSGKQTDLKTSILDTFEENEIGHMTCLGRCHENGAFHFNGVNHSNKSKAEIEEIFSGKTSNFDDYNVNHFGKPLLTESYDGLEQHYAHFKSILEQPKEDILKEIQLSNIRGRGGAGFPMGFKLESCMNTDSDIKFIICNADEGDPGAYSDRYLLEKRPHSVLFGMMAAGYITGASWGVLYIRAEYPEAAITIQDAINELRDNELIGPNILKSGFNFDFKIIKAQGAYICGEETALINSIEGQRPEVRVRPPFPTQQGLFRKPTIVNNVETLAAVYTILKYGGAAYANMGTERSKGTKLVCLDSFFNNPGIYEVEMGTPLSIIINDLGGGFKSPVKAMPNWRPIRWYSANIKNK